MAQIQPIADLENYVDIPDALTRVCGNKMIYKKLLGTFEKTLQYDQMMAEIAAGDLETAARTAHSIKGVAANLSLKAAYEALVKVEGQLKAGEANAADLEELGRILETTLQCTAYVAATL